MFLLASVLARSRAVSISPALSLAVVIIEALSVWASALVEVG